MDDMDSAAGADPNVDASTVGVSENIAFRKDCCWAVSASGLAAAGVMAGFDDGATEEGEKARVGGSGLKSEAGDEAPAGASDNATARASDAISFCANVAGSRDTCSIS